ncbi:MAG: DUF4476 domain-containing protein [Bacteroidota bacterium]|jgi:hypothetical protein
MIKKFLALAILVSFGFIANAQTANLILFTENGEQFTAILNGIQQNSKPETNVKISGLNAEYYKLKIRFVDNMLGEKNFNINLALGEETTYCIKKNNKGEYVTRFMSNVPLDQAPSAPASQAVVVYNANPAAANANTTVTHQQTTTTTTNGTSNPDNVNISLGINVDGMGGGINMNVSGANLDMDNTSSVHSTTTTTTTTTHSSSGYDSHAGHNHPHSNPAPAPVVYLPGYNGPIGCPVPMSPNDFSDLKRTVNSKTFEDTKLTIAKQVVSSQCLLTNQVKDLLGCFTFEANKLEMAKNCYSHTYDIGNYFKVNDVFTFESSIEELNEYIESRK